MNPYGLDVREETTQSSAAFIAEKKCNNDVAAKQTQLGMTLIGGFEYCRRFIYETFAETMRNYS
jgi:hypothetical protein